MEHAYEMEYHVIRLHAEQAKEELFIEQRRPFYLLKPKLTIDGNQWCFLYGDDLATGVAGFGDTPIKAAEAFDFAWLNYNLKSRPA